jgi:arsenate reductase/ArsR family transcriptional regulator
VLGLAPSTVSKHLTILKIAGLVEDRRDGKWIEYALIQEARNPYAKALLAMLRGPLDREPAVIADRKRLREIKTIPLVELCTLTPARAPAAPIAGRHRVRGGRHTRGVTR